MLLPFRIRVASGVLTWLVRLGGPGLILLGIADNSVVPMPGSMDVMTIWLAASHREWWWFYGLMATLGALLGGYITYALARKGGKEAVEHKVGNKKKVEKVYERFKRWGFGAVALPALLPPPFPMVPFLVAAGAMQYPRKKFIAALALGRGVRFMIVAGMGAIYGEHIVHFFRQYYKPALIILIGLAVIGAIVSIVEYIRHRHRQHGQAGQPHAKAA